MDTSGLRIIASFALIGGLIWFLISVLRAIFPRWRSRALLSVRRSAVLMVMGLLGSVWLNEAADPKLHSQVVETPAADTPQEVEARTAREAEARRIADTHRVAEEAERTEKLRLAHWDVRYGRSQIDDSRTVQITTRSLRTHANRYGQQRPLILTIVCRENKTNAHISFAEHFMSDIQGGGKVTYRVDAKPAKNRNFRESNDHSVLGLWGGGSSIPWLRELFGAEKLIVRATPFSESAVEGEFNISGLEEVINPLREACNW